MTTNPSTLPLPRLADRHDIVTGSTSGIGTAIAHRLASDGAHVIVSGRDVTRGHGVVADIRAGGGRADYVAVDLAGSYDDIRGFARDATDLLGGRVDILVNNAGVYPAPPTIDLLDADLDTMLAVNIRAPHVLVAAIAPSMAERGRGGDRQRRLVDGQDRQPVRRHVQRDQGRRGTVDARVGCRVRTARRTRQHHRTGRHTHPG